MTLRERIARGPATAAEPVRAVQENAGEKSAPPHTPAWVARNVQRGGPIVATKALTR